MGVGGGGGRKGKKRKEGEAACDLCHGDFELAEGKKKHGQCCFRFSHKKNRD